MDESEEQPKNHQKAWIKNALSVLVFLLIFGSHLLPQMARMLAPLIGQNLAQQLANLLNGGLPVIIVGLIVLSIAWSIIGWLGRTVGSINASSEQNSPSSTYTSATYTSAPASSGSAWQASQFDDDGDYQSTADYSADYSERREAMGHYDQTIDLDRSPLPIARSESAQREPAWLADMADTGTEPGYRPPSLPPAQPPYKTPGFDPIIDGKVLIYGAVIGGVMLTIFIGALVVFGAP